MTDSIEELATKLEAVIAQLAGDPEIPRTDSDQLIIYCGGSSTSEPSPITFGDLRRLRDMSEREKALREALEPFAVVADKLDGGWTSGNRYLDGDFTKVRIEAGVFRVARKALEAK